VALGVLLFFFFFKVCVFQIEIHHTVMFFFYVFSVEAEEVEDTKSLCIEKKKKK